jgi:hypothetical protein
MQNPLKTKNIATPPNVAGVSSCPSARFMQ